MNKRLVGSFYESLACKYILESGGRIIEKNYRACRGDIDIIAYDGRYLCFVEVKYRKDGIHGSPESAVNHQKKKQICKISMFYLYSKVKSFDIPIRFDVIAISGEQDALVVKWYKNAFDYI